MRTYRENWDQLNVNQKLGLLIRGYRRRYPYTIKAVSQKSGIKLGRLRDIEAGRRKPIKVEELLALHKTCFLLPLMAFKHIFPDEVDPYEYVNGLTKKKRKRKAKRKA